MQLHRLAAPNLKVLRPFADSKQADFLHFTIMLHLPSLAGDSGKPKVFVEGSFGCHSLAGVCVHTCALTHILKAVFV